MTLTLYPALPRKTLARSIRQGWVSCVRDDGDIIAIAFLERGWDLGWHGWMIELWDDLGGSPWNETEAYYTGKSRNGLQEGLMIYSNCLRVLS